MAIPTTKKRLIVGTAPSEKRRKQIDRLIRKHPVLKIHLEQALEQCYLDGTREDASDETNLDIDVFPVSCPYSIAEIRDREF